MLKDNAIPILFDHDKDNQPITRRSTFSRNEIAQKKQYCEEAFELYDKFEKLQYEIKYVKKSRQPERPETSRHKQTSFMKKNLFSVFSESDSSICSDFDSNDNKDDTKKAQHLLFSGRL